MLSAARYPYEALMTREQIKECCRKGAEKAAMTATVYQIRDYQSAKELERMRKLAEEAAKIMAPFVETTGFTDTGPCETIPYGGTGIDGMDLGPTKS